MHWGCNECETNRSSLFCRPARSITTRARARFPDLQSSDRCSSSRRFRPASVNCRCRRVIGSTRAPEAKPTTCASRNRRRNRCASFVWPPRQQPRRPPPSPDPRPQPTALRSPQRTAKVLRRARARCRAASTAPARRRAQRGHFRSAPSALAHGAGCVVPAAAARRASGACSLLVEECYHPTSATRRAADARPVRRARTSARCPCLTHAFASPCPPSASRWRFGLRCRRGASAMLLLVHRRYSAAILRCRPTATSDSRDGPSPAPCPSRLPHVAWLL